MLTDAEKRWMVDEICMPGCSDVMLVKYQHNHSHKGIILDFAFLYCGVYSSHTKRNNQIKIIKLNVMIV